jgi:hypothetical protein
MIGTSSITNLTLLVSYISGDLLRGCVTVGLSRRTQLHAVGQLRNAREIHSLQRRIFIIQLHYATVTAPVAIVLQDINTLGTVIESPHDIILLSESKEKLKLFVILWPSWKGSNYVN